MSKRSSEKELKKKAAKFLNLKELFPRSRIDLRTKLTKYQAGKIKKALRIFEETVPPVAEGYTVLAPDRPDYYEAAGFPRQGDYIAAKDKKLKIHTLYHAEGVSEFYSASFFGGVVNAQIIPTVSLPYFLEKQIEIDEEEGKFYDLITLRENSREMFRNQFETAEELLLWLTHYLRHGALIGTGQTFEFIQVCFINLE